MTENGNRKEAKEVPEPNIPDEASKPKCEPAKRTETTTQNQNVQTPGSKWVTKNWQALLATIFSLIAVGFSIDSCVISNQANQLSQRAIDTAIDQFYQENKPYIILKPIKYGKLQSYYKYTPLPEQNAVKMELQYQIKNIGRAAAKDLVVFDKLITAKHSIQVKDLNIPDKVTLGPSEECVLGVAALSKWDDRESYNRYLQKLSTEEGPALTIRMGVTYLSEVNPKQTFISAIASKITKRKAQIVKIEYEAE